MNTNQTSRVFATLIIWTAITALGAGTMVNSDSLGGGPVILIVAMLLGAAVVATEKVWTTPKNDVQVDAEKAKRQGKVDRMLEKLSEQEIEDLRARLMSEADGEQVSLEELLEAHEHGRL